MKGVKKQIVTWFGGDDEDDFDLNIEEQKREFAEKIAGGTTVKVLNDKLGDLDLRKNQKTKSDKIYDIIEHLISP